MLRSFNISALSLIGTALAGPLFAQPTPGPPEWEDARPSIYLQLQKNEPAHVEQMQSPPVAVEMPARDGPVTQAVHRAAAPVAMTDDARRLAPRSGRIPSGSSAGAKGAIERQPSSSATPVNIGLPLQNIYTIVSALAIVVGAFLIFAWLLRRGARKSMSLLPADVVSVLGRVPLSARQFAELLRVGNKLVLVSLTPTGAETLTEVTDPVEVDRLVGLCQQFNLNSTTKAFEQVFRQLSRETVPAGLLGADALPPGSSVAGAYRAQRGDTARA